MQRNSSPDDNKGAGGIEKSGDSRSLFTNTLCEEVEDHRSD